MGILIQLLPQYLHPYPQKQGEGWEGKGIIMRRDAQRDFKCCNEMFSFNAGFTSANKHRWAHSCCSKKRKTLARVFFFSFFTPAKLAGKKIALNLNILYDSMGYTPEIYSGTLIKMNDTFFLYEIFQCGQLLCHIWLTSHLSA